MLLHLVHSHKHSCAHTHKHTHKHTHTLGHTHLPHQITQPSPSEQSAFPIRSISLLHQINQLSPSDQSDFPIRSFSLPHHINQPSPLGCTRLCSQSHTLHSQSSLGYTDGCVHPLPT